MSRITPKRLALVGTGAAAVLAIGIAVPTVAFAEGSTSSPTSSTAATAQSDSAQTGASARAQRQAEHRAERQARMAELLADELGVSKDKVAEALDAVQTKLREDARTQRQDNLRERLDAAVEKGALTQEQADAILAAAQAGVLGNAGPKWAGGHGPSWAGGHGQNWHGR